MNPENLPENVKEALKRIDTAKQKGKSELELCKLGLDNDQLAYLIQIISKSFENLKELNLSYNNFSELPAEIWSLRKLKVLSMTGANFYQLSADISKLRELEKLLLNFNQFSEIPEELAQLEHINHI